MPLPANTSHLIEFLRPGAVPAVDFDVSVDDGGQVVIERYDAAAIGQPVPTEQELANAAADITTVDHPEGLVTFSEWRDGRGADPVKTKRRRARAALDTDTGTLVKALALSVLDLINVERAEHSRAAITPGQLLTLMRGHINDGSAD